MKARKFLAALGLTLSAATANAVVLTFDDLPAGTTVTNQYAGLGVTFTPFLVDGFAPFVVTSPNAGLAGPTLITATFAFDVNSVSAHFFDTEVGSILAVFNAYDVDGNFLGASRPFRRQIRLQAWN